MKSRFKKSAHEETETPLQITSMADILTILLVFLLKSFSTGATNLTPPIDLTLPAAATSDASTTDDLAEAARLEVSPNAVSYEEHPVAPLAAFRFPASDLEGDGTSKTLNNYFATQFKKPKEASPNHRVLLLADRQTPYATVRSVLASAGRAGFTDFQLVVVSSE